ncbi:MAG: response regulator [SAR202 cluster bacterium]|nr:response regulator [SAR202 cluster bacterium]
MTNEQKSVQSQSESNDGLITKPHTVLIIEDDPALRHMLRICFRPLGFTVLEAGTGQEGLGVLEAGLPSAVVLDLGLPDGLGGAVLDRLRRNAGPNSSPPAWVVISALERDEVARRYGDLGSQLLSKPFDPWQLVRLIESLIKDN